MPEDMPVSQLKNFGPKSSQWLNHIGIYTLKDLRSWDMYDIYAALKLEGIPVNRVMLYAVWGALNNVDWKAVPPDVKAEIARQIQRLK